MLADAELRNAFQPVMVEAKRMKFFDTIANPRIVDPRRVPIVDLRHGKNCVLRDQVFVQFASLTMESVGVWRTREFLRHARDSHTVTNTKSAPKIIHQVRLRRLTEGFYDTALNEAVDV